MKNIQLQTFKIKGYIIYFWADDNTLNISEYWTRRENGFYFGQCDALHRFVPNSDVVVGTPNDEDVFTCKATSEQVTDQVKLDVNLLKT